VSTIKSSDEHLTLNADGSSKDIKFQANGVEKASISSAGAFTSTTIDATVLTGNLPAISAASLTNVPAANITGTLPAISGANLTGLTGNVFNGNFTRNIATAGTLALTGFGFTPKAIQFAYGNAYSGLNIGFGYQWSTSLYNCVITSPWTATGNWNVQPANGEPITFYSPSGSSSNRTDGKVTSFDSDGVTITFSTPTGSPSGNMRIIYTAWG
jgi:hypothetical protein